MIRAHIDTPWHTLADGTHVPALVVDARFEADIASWSDVTGAEGAYVDLGGGVQRKLFGGNYAKALGVSPDYEAGRLGGSGDPDWLTLEVTLEDEATLEAIGSEDEYIVYWQESIAGEVGARANGKGPDEPPAQAEFGLWRAKMARRGVSQAWIDEFVGQGINGRTRRAIDSDVKDRGYVTGQYNRPGAPA